MADNGSPSPSFETDETSTYVLVVLPAHNGMSNGASNGVKLPLFKDLKEIVDYGNGASNGASNGAGAQAVDIISREIHDRVAEMLGILESKMKRAELFELMDLSNQTKNRIKFLDPLIKIGWIQAEFPTEKTNPLQTYTTTVAGKKIIELLNAKSSA
jgi:ATP-dependent DNA helicase RecG